MVAFSLRGMTVAIAAAGAALAVASCNLPPPTATQVQASNPRVTYKYNTDEALIQANQNATVFCGQYQAFPRTVSFTNDPDGGKAVVFDCMPKQPGMAALPATPANPPLTYNFRTDQELLDASRNAQNYCTSVGSPRLSSTVSTNAYGGKTVGFQCGTL